MNRRKKRPLSITLAAAVILCIITFVIGILIPSVFLLDSRIESANEEIASLKNTVSEQKKEISSLNDTISARDEANIILGEKINDHLLTIEQLQAQISKLEGEVDFAAEAAISGISSGSDRNRLMISSLSSRQLLVILASLLVLVIFIISVTCGVIASVKKPSDHAKSHSDEGMPSPEDIPLPSFDEEAPPEEDQSQENSPEHGEQTEDNVSFAVEALYSNTLEDTYASLGGFLFGITNYDDVLNNRANGKSFGNSDSGDFVAFMEESADVKKLYIIPRYMSLSDSAVTLRGMTDLFDIADESGEEKTHGSVKIKSVNSPAVFAFGDNGWAIEAKGSVTVLDTTYQN